MSDQFPPPSSYGTPPSGSGYGPPPPGSPPTGQPNYGSPPPADHPRATTILVLGILSLVCCGPFAGIPAWVMGASALKEIDRSGGRIGGRGTVKAGWICGIIGTVLSVLGLLFYGALIIIGFSTGEFDTY